MSAKPWFRRDQAPCTCPREPRPLPRVDGVNMGVGMTRLSTTKDCPEHDACHGFTAAVRGGHDNGPWLYCPIHKRKDCP